MNYDSSVVYHCVQMATEGQFSTSLTTLVATNFGVPKRLQCESTGRIKLQKVR